MAQRTAFGVLLDELLAQRGLTQAAFARLVGKAPGVVQFIRTGRRTPPLDAIAGWADALRLRGGERERFLETARLEHCPPEIRALVAALRRELSGAPVRRAAESRRGYRTD